MIAGPDDSGEGEVHRSAVDLRQDGVEGGAVPVAGDKDGNVVLMEARMSGLAAPFARRARQIGPAALEGFEDKGLIRLDNPAQRSRFVVRGRRRNRCRQRNAVVG